MNSSSAEPTLGNGSPLLWGLCEASFLGIGYQSWFKLIADTVGHNSRLYPLRLLSTWEAECSEVELLEYCLHLKNTGDVKDLQLPFWAFQEVNLPPYSASLRKGVCGAIVPTT